MNKIAFGCSHTYGIGIERTKAWPSLLGAINYGVPGTSADSIVRRAPSIIDQTNPDIIYVLWPDWTRFEYIEQGEFKQSLPTDSNRISFMEQATDEWLHDNFNKQIYKFQKLCNEYNIKLIDMTLYDLIPYIDHADKWPRANDGMHFNHEWHRWVADIFNEKT
jgi:hypothetical protein